MSIMKIMNKNKIYYTYTNFDKCYKTRKMNINIIDEIVELRYLSTERYRLDNADVHLYEIMYSPDERLIGEIHKDLREQVYMSKDRLYKYFYDMAIAKKWKIDSRVKSIFEFSQQEYPEDWI